MWRLLFVFCDHSRTSVKDSLPAERVRANRTNAASNRLAIGQCSAAYRAIAGQASVGDSRAFKISRYSSERLLLLWRAFTRADKLSSGYLAQVDHFSRVRRGEIVACVGMQAFHIQGS